MKKQFKLLTTFILLCVMGINATAATLGNTPKIKNIRVRELDTAGGTSYKIVVVVKHDDADQVATVGVTMEPIGKSPEPSAKSFTLKPVKKNENRYVSSDLTFKTGALDFEYLVTATMYDAKGNKVGEPETAWVTVDAKGEDYETDPCDSQLALENPSTSVSFDEKGNQTIHLNMPLSAKKGNPNLSFWNNTKWTLASHFVNSKTGYIQTNTATPKFNEKTGVYEVDYTFTNTDKENYWSVEVITGTVTNPCGDVYYPRAADGDGRGCLAIRGTWYPRLTTSAPDTCGKPDIDSLFWEVGSYDKTTGTTSVFVHFPKTYVDFNIGGVLDPRADAKAQDSKGNTEAQYTAMKLNEKTGWYEGLLFFEEISSGEAFSIIEIGVTVTNACGDSYGFVGKRIQRGIGSCACDPGYAGHDRVSSTDSCNTKFKLKEVDYETANAAGLYTMQFSFNFGNNSDAPSEVVMAAQLTNCKGQTINIKLKMYYNANTGTYYCGQSIKQDKDCEWKLTYAEVGAYNPCKELTWWGLDFSQVKSNGKGTTNTASTTSQTQPKLL